MLGPSRSAPPHWVLWLEVGEYYEALDSFPVSIHETETEARTAEIALKAFIGELRESLPAIAAAIDYETHYPDSLVYKRLLAIAANFGWREDQLSIVQAVLNTKTLNVLVKDAPLIPSQSSNARR